MTGLYRRSMGGGEKGNREGRNILEVRWLGRKETSVKCR